MISHIQWLSYWCSALTATCHCGQAVKHVYRHALLTWGIITNHHGPDPGLVPCLPLATLPFPCHSSCAGFLACFAPVCLSPRKCFLSSYHPPRWRFRFFFFFFEYLLSVQYINRPPLQIILFISHGNPLRDGYHSHHLKDVGFKLKRG